MNLVAPALVRTSNLLHLKARFNTFWLVIVVLNKAPFAAITEDDTEQTALDDAWKVKTLLH
jgi:hypothetical protein